jgi:L-fuconolactonase
MTVVDAHHHYWRIDGRPRTPAHDYEPEHLRGELRTAGVTATVLVQSADEPAENDRLRAYQSATPTVAGVVAWLPLRDPIAARRELDRIEGMPRLSGVRCLVGREPLDWLAGADVRALFGELADRGLAWDVVAVTTGQVDAVCELAAAVPRLRIVVDHLARPPLDGAPWEPWAGAVRALAACPGVALKLSVGIDALTAWERWDASALSGCVAYAVEQFTPHRLMLASNWPVVLLRCSYAQAWRDMSAAVAKCGVTGAGREAVLGAAAVRWYGLAVPAP